MAELYLVPERVREGSPSPISDLNRYRAEWMRARNNPNGFWLEETTRNIAWMTPPTQGLRGDYRSVRDAPPSAFPRAERQSTRATCTPGTRA